jgi:hypothetical protein
MKAKTITDRHGTKIRCGSIVVPSDAAINMPPLTRHLKGSWVTSFRNGTPNTKKELLLCIGHEPYNADGSILHLFSPTIGLINLFAHEVTAL